MHESIRGVLRSGEGACLRGTPPLALLGVCWEAKSTRVTRGNALHGKFKRSLDNEAAALKWEVA